MKSAKEEVRDLLEKLPDDASLDDIQYHSTSVKRSRKVQMPPIVERSFPGRKPKDGWRGGSRDSLDRSRMGRS